MPDSTKLQDYIDTAKANTDEDVNEVLRIGNQPRGSETQFPSSTKCLLRENCVLLRILIKTRSSAKGCNQLSW